ncbi:unnamed protein product [Eruca vesicaria subsp. sativa]|uniref:Uncharacterized protein n=1 Tax=Eruca vesicaria subsp. sativa TaxID=29727 RepID=A0ABC8JYD8_ERUVS|nr:unnamed protein product [Eruca vesicaria subsp. sativa]
MARICNLATTEGANWGIDGWMDVRSHPSEEEEATIEYLDYITSLNPYDDVADELARIDVTVYPNRPPGNWDSAAERACEKYLRNGTLIEDSESEESVHDDGDMGGASPADDQLIMPVVNVIKPLNLALR